MEPDRKERPVPIEGQIPLVHTDGWICWGAGWIRPGKIVIQKFVNGEYLNEMEIDTEEDFVVAYFKPKERE